VHTTYHKLLKAQQQHINGDGSNNCISEGLTQVSAWYHGTPGPKFTKFRK